MGLAAGLMMVLVPAGAYVPFFSNSAQKIPTAVPSFWMDVYPVTRGEYLRFLAHHSKWTKSKVPGLFADAHYLDDWDKDLDPHSPVTQVSWFAAKAYCESLAKELPTTDQWEYAAGDLGRNADQNRAKILAWYSQPTPAKAPAVGRTSKNGFGVSDLLGLVWEWTLDFNSATLSEESRDGGVGDSNLFCGNGSQGARDAADYATFMRYSFRNSLKANYTTKNLGFRCVKEAGHEGR